MKFRVSLLTVLILMLCSATVWGHAHLRTSSPAADAVVTQRPTEVVLTFSEAVELLFSTFKVYPVPAASDHDALKAAAAELVAQVLNKKDDEAARVDRGLVQTTGASATVQIKLIDDLAPGTYVAMWSVLSTDTHSTSGHLVFTYEPDGA